MLNPSDPISKVPLIGPKYEKLLLRLGISTIQDLLRHFPSRYIDFSNIKRVRDLTMGEDATIVGIVNEVKNIYTKTGKIITKLVLSNEEDFINVIWFNQPFLVKFIRVGASIAVSGRVDYFNNEKTIISPEYEMLTSNKEVYIHTGRLVPIYSETKGLSSKWLRSRIYFLLTRNLNVEETLPESVIKSQHFTNINIALKNIHFPANFKEVENSRKRFGFEEIYNLLLKAKSLKSEWSSNEASKSFKQHKFEISKFIENLPFKLTDSQILAINEIISDLSKKSPMNRLLQGDVGSGKTVVAAVASYLSYLNGCKTFYMAPTEILANQHYTTFKELLKPYKINVQLTTGNKKGDRNCDINIGTHALIYDKHETPNLGLVIIDEQHRFGVKQRADLVKRSGEKLPHILSMTATPIPRSLSLTIYGNLDLSSLTEMPKGERLVNTWIVPNYKREKAYVWVKEQIIISRHKNQAFIICPLIEESDDETMANVKAATSEFLKLKSTVFNKLKIGLLHGKMTSIEKAKNIDLFRKKKLNVLVATPVIEVGIDVPSATIVIIEAAERFGLASLHQIRGRVGRGGEKSYCLLFTQSKDINTISRLKLLETSQNGLFLAEEDLKLRGPGEFFGYTQHGKINFKIADPTDLKLIQEVKKYI